MNLLEDVHDYYKSKILKFGVTPNGVDWKDEDGQIIRFHQLLKIVNTKRFSISDVGCGYGAIVDVLESDFKNHYIYNGVDICEEMILEARKRFNTNPHVSFDTGKEPISNYDFLIASGIFNVRLNSSHQNWLDYIFETLKMMNEKSKDGFSFNCLTKYSDKERMADNLYYADPCLIFDYCKKNFSKNVSLLHDYGLYEFTILVRKNI